VCVERLVMLHWQENILTAVVIQKFDYGKKVYMDIE
jgi:hypothetical protein